MNIILYIPVYNGTNFFKECLESVAKHIDCFHTIIVSINKSKNQDIDIKIWNEFKKINKINKITIIKNKEYSAIAHTRKNYRVITSSIKNIPDCYVMWLCHDDVLLSDFSICMKQISEIISPDVAINPARSFYKDKFEESREIFSYYVLSSYKEGIDKDDFISFDIDRHYRTNISGCIIHKNAFIEALKIVTMLRYGYRAEYIHLASKSINRILGTNTPIIGIRVTEGQQGRQEHRFYRLIDDNIYFIYEYITTNNDFLKKKIAKISPFIMLINGSLKDKLRLLYRYTIKNIIPYAAHKYLKAYVLNEKI